MKKCNTVFPDTNSLLHYPAIDQVNWTRVAGSPSVTLVFAMQVIHELDEKKNHPTLSSRASRTIHEVQKYRSSGGTLPSGNTVVRIFPYEPRSEEFGLTLNPEVGDDRIVKTVLEYQKRNPEAVVAVFTEDLGMTLKCETHGLQVLKPEPATRLQTPHSELERKLLSANQEIERLRQSHVEITCEARCDLKPDYSSSPFLILSMSGTDIEPNHEHEVTEQCSRLGVVRENIGGLTSKDLVNADMLKILHMGVTDDDLDRYAQRVDAYLAQYRDWLTKRDQYEREAPLQFCFHLRVQNVGSRRARNAVARLSFPPVLRFIKYESQLVGAEFHPPSKPRDPEAPMSAAERRMRGLEYTFGRATDGGIRSLSSISQQSNFGPKVECLGTEEAGFTIVISIPSLSQHEPVEFTDFHAMFAGWPLAKSFQVAIELFADEMTTREIHSANVIVECQPSETS